MEILDNPKKSRQHKPKTASVVRPRKPKNQNPEFSHTDKNFRISFSKDK